MRLPAIVLASIAGAAACNQGSHAAPSSSSAAPSAASGAPDAELHASAPHEPAPGPTPNRATLEAHLHCRAIAVDGAVRLEDADAGTATMTNLSEIPGDAWVSLAQGARLVAKDPRTTRETTFPGPGRVRVCPDQREESWVSEGGFESAAGSGESPGAEEWVVTPHAVVRYAAARVRVDVSVQRTRVALANGAAFAWPPQTDAGTSEGWQRLAATETTFTGRPASDERAAAAAVDRCVEIAGRSQALARALLGAREGDGGADPRPSDQVTTRRIARAACGMAALRVDALPAGDRRGQLLARVRDGEAAYRSLPVVSQGSR